MIPPPSGARTVLFALPLFVAAFSPALSQTASNDRAKYHYYRDLPYGSEAMYHPVGVLMNGGLDVLQSYAWSTHFSAIPWDVGGTSVWQSVRAPAYWINQYGWSKFLSQEVFPAHFDPRRAQWVPNYFLHAIGGGMEYRKLSEWYDAHRFPVPFLCGAVTAMSYHYLNELVENGNGYHPNTDAIADLLIFDPLGILLFSFDGISRYFSDVWMLNDWSPQASVTFGPLAFRNFGHTFVARYFPHAESSTGLFLHLGKSTLAGLSLRTTSGKAISFGAGMTQTGVWKVDTENGIPTNSIDVGAAAGVFYDRNNSLLASLLVSEYSHERVRVNVYPGVLWNSPDAPGAYATLGDRGTFSIGVTISAIPFGIGLFSPR